MPKWNGNANHFIDFLYRIFMGGMPCENHLLDFYIRILLGALGAFGPIGGSSPYTPPLQACLFQMMTDYPCGNAPCMHMRLRSSIHTHMFIQSMVLMRHDSVPLIQDMYAIAYVIRYCYILVLRPSDSVPRICRFKPR